jgi:hypothetical protein
MRKSSPPSHPCIYIFVPVAQLNADFCVSISTNLLTDWFYSEMSNNLDQVINFYYFTVKEERLVYVFIHLFIQQIFTE